MPLRAIVERRDDATRFSSYYHAFIPLIMILIAVRAIETAFWAPSARLRELRHAPRRRCPDGRATRVDSFFRPKVAIHWHTLPPSPRDSDYFCHSGRSQHDMHRRSWRHAEGAPKLLVLTAVISPTSLGRRRRAYAFWARESSTAAARNDARHAFDCEF